MNRLTKQLHSTILIISIFLTFVLGNVHPQTIQAGQISQTRFSSPKSLVPRLVGHIGGKPYDIHVQGNLAYLTEGSGLTILDFSNPNAPIVTGKTPPLFSNSAQSVTLAGDYAYITTSSSTTEIIDITDPTNPMIRGKVAGGGNDLAVQGDYAFVATGSGLVVVDVSDPDQPVYVKTTGGSHLKNIALQNSYVYVTIVTGGFMIYDISTPTNPIYTGYYSTNNTSMGVIVSGDYAYVADGRLRVLDISDPANPIQVGQYLPPVGAWAPYHLSKQGNYVFLTSNGVRVIDVSNPTLPIEVSSFVLDPAPQPENIFVSGSYAYLLSSFYGLQILDVSNPANPVLEGGYTALPGDGNSIKVVGTTAFIANGPAGLRLVDVSDPAFPQEVNAYDAGSSVVDVTVSEDLAYLTGYSTSQDTLKILNVADPGNLSLVGKWKAPNPARGEAIVVDGNTAYLAGTWSYIGTNFARLWSVDVTDPALPVGLGNTPSCGPSSVSDVVIDRGFSYLGGNFCYDRKLEVYSLANPNTPQLTAAYTDTLDSITDLFISSSKLYTRGRNLKVFDLNIPGKPVLLADKPLEWGGGLYVTGDTLVTGNGFSLKVFDIADPADVLEVGSYDLPEQPTAMEISGTMVYVMTNTAGLFIFELSSGSQISGRVTDQAGAPLQNVAISLDNGLAAVTDAGGEYILNDLLTGTYTVTPTLNGYSFLPENRTITVPPSTSEADFGAQPSQNWVYLFYIAADNNLDSTYPPAINQLELAADNPEVQVVTAWDRRGQNNSAYYWIQPDNNLFRFANYVEGENYWPQIEFNTGDPENLVQFVQWAQARFPAQHYALILSDHGSGLGGGMIDDTSGKDLLTLKDMDNALNQITANGIRKIDVLYLDTCLMAMLEDIYQFRNYARYYVGSENLQWSWADPYYHYVADVSAGSTPADVAAILTNAYADAGTTRSGSFTISAVDLNYLSNVITATNALAGELDQHMQTISNTLNTIHLIVQKYEMNGDNLIDETDEYIDLFDFAFLVKGLIVDNDVKTAAQGLMEALVPFVIAERHGSDGAWDLEHSHGVSIFWPDQSSSFYNPDNYDFAVGADWSQLLSKNAIHRPGATGWGSLLVDYIQAVYPGSNDSSTPPEVQPKLDGGYHIYLPLAQK